jgi:hypothetical protein
MAITVKKKKMTVSAPAEEAQAEEPAAEQAPASEPVPVGKAPSYAAFAILALVACLLFGAVIGLLWMEKSSYVDAFPASSAAAVLPAE